MQCLLLLSFDCHMLQIMPLHRLPPGDRKISLLAIGIGSG